jgi:hypothetical protein
LLQILSVIYTYIFSHLATYSGTRQPQLPHVSSNYFSLQDLDKCSINFLFDSAVSGYFFDSREKFREEKQLPGSPARKVRLILSEGRG